jgi:tRNA pseudouridine55 synthase
LFLGRATRLVEYHAADRKQYRATICVGARSTTDDLDGELTPVDGPLATREAVLAALAGLTGAIEQRPPAFSAVRIGGRRAYALARAGEAPALAPRTVTVHRLELVDWDDRDPARPVAIVDVECSPGTYVRAIARDLGEALGSGAYLGALVRTASGPFRLADAVSLDDLRVAVARDPGSLAEWLLPIDAGLESLARVELTPTEVADVAMGRFVRPAGRVPAVPDGAPVRLVDPSGRLVGIGLRRGVRLAPTKVLIDRGSDSADPDRAGSDHHLVPDPDPASFTGQEPASAGRRPIRP